MATATLYLTKDSYLSQSSSDLGTATTLACGQIVVFSVPVRNRIIVELDLRPLANSRIDSAVLRFALIVASFIDAPHLLSVHEIQGEWDEATADWTERDTATDWTTAGGDYWPWTVITQNITNGDTSLSLDITDYVERHRGEVVSLILILPEGSGHDNHYFTAHSTDDPLGFAVLAQRVGFSEPHAVPLPSVGLVVCYCVGSCLFVLLCSLLIALLARPLHYLPTLRAQSLRLAGHEPPPGLSHHPALCRCCAGTA